MPPAKRGRVDAPEDRIPTRGNTDAHNPFVVELPAGGPLTLDSANEVVMWNETRDRYIRDYKLVRTNDLVLLGAILSSVLMMYRAQTDLADPKKAPNAMERISKAAAEMRVGEKALGVDKATREKGGSHTVADYVTRLKRAGYEKGVHLSKRMLAYEQVMMEARWKIRLLRNGDAEDRAYHNLSEKAILDWLEQELAKLEEADKTWSKERGAIFVGKL